MKRLLLALLLLAAADARAAGADDAGDDLAARPDGWIRLDGSLRMRGDLLDNLDLDRGLDPSGRPLFAVPRSPDGQLLTRADSRLRADLAAFAPAGGLSVRARFDLADGTGLAAPSGEASPDAVRPKSVLEVRQAYAEALLPVGLLSAGRLPVRWGLGLLANGGDCADCNGGDAADGVAFATPAAGLIWSASWAFSSAGAFDARPSDAPVVGLTPSAPASIFTLAVVRWRGPESLRRRREAGRVTVDWGALATSRREDDRTGSWGAGSGGSAGALRAPAYRAAAADGWLRLTFPRLRIEAEAAVLTAKVPQPSMIPGVELPHPVRSTQAGAALESEWGVLSSRFGLGLDFGFASGDPAPGFGADPVYSGRAPQAGDLDDPQAVPPGDYRVDNFRFHPDYRVDRILFHELVGTVTDAVYTRPHARVALARWTTGELRAELAAIGSRAIDPSSTPGGKAPLGVEVDPTIAWEGSAGFSFALEHAVLFPLAGLDNPRAGLSAKPAQRIALRMSWGF